MKKEPLERTGRVRINKIPYNWTVEEERLSEKGPKWVVLGYHPSVEQCVTTALDIRTGQLVEDGRGILEAIREARADLLANLKVEGRGR